MRTFLTVTAVLELGAGLALAVFPSPVVGILVGARPQTPAEFTVVRVTAAALLALGVACWLARDDSQSPAARGLVAGMMVYNIGVVAALAYAGFVLGTRAMGLWPAMALHAAMTAWRFMPVKH